MVKENNITSRQRTSKGWKKLVFLTRKDNETKTYLRAVDVDRWAERSAVRMQSSANFIEPLFTVSCRY